MSYVWCMYVHSLFFHYSWGNGGFEIVYLMKCCIYIFFKKIFSGGDMVKKIK